MSSRAGGGDDDGVVLGQHEAELPEGTVAAVSVPGHPELEAVALVGSARSPGVGLRRVASHPVLGHQLGALPPASLQVQLAELGDVLGGGVQPGEA